MLSFHLTPIKTLTSYYTLKKKDKQHTHIYNTEQLETKTIFERIERMEQNSNTS